LTYGFVMLKLTEVVESGLVSKSLYITVCKGLQGKTECGILVSAKLGSRNRIIECF